MDSIKEIFEAMGQRIRSPFLGYVFLSFVFLNWKPLYYLAFSEVSAPVKFRFFDLNTTWESLYVLPLLFGLIATLFSPYISEYAARWAEKPINRKRLREVEAAHEVLKAKNMLAADRENQRAIFEQSLIDQAKRDEQIEEIEDPNKRAAVSQEVERIRKNSLNDQATDVSPSMALEKLAKDELSHEHKKLIFDLAENTHGECFAIYRDDSLFRIVFRGLSPDSIDVQSSRRLLVRFQKVLDDLEGYNIIERGDEIRMKINEDPDGTTLPGIPFLMTLKGYEWADDLTLESL